MHQESAHPVMDSIVDAFEHLQSFQQQLGYNTLFRSRFRSGLYLAVSPGNPTSCLLEPLSLGGGRVQVTAELQVQNNYR